MIAVGQIREVMVYIDEDPDQPENVFFEPMPMRMVKKNDDDDEEEDSTYMSTMGAFNQLKCSFGRFGDTDAVFIDERTIKCATPATADDPNDVYAEEVSFSVSLNGLTFAEEGSEQTMPFTFEGTAEPMGLLPVVLFIIALGVLLVAVIVYVKRKFEHDSIRDD